MNSPAISNIPVNVKQQLDNLILEGELQPALDTLQTIPTYEAIAKILLNRYSAIEEKESKGLVIPKQSEADYNQLTEDLVKLLSGDENDLPKLLSPLVPLLPNNYLERDELKTIGDAILRQSESYYGITGMPGCGKTVLAVALARNKKIQIAFEGAVFWVGINDKLQENIGNITAMRFQEQLYLQLSEDPTAQPTFETRQQGLIALQKMAREKFAEKKCLVIVDYPPDINDLLDAVELHENAIFLVITSDASLLYAKGISREAIFQIGGLNKEKSLDLLFKWAETKSETYIGRAEEIVAKLGFLPLAIVMAGASIKGAIDEDAAWSDVLEAINESDLKDFRLSTAGDLHSLFRLALARLDEDERTRFYDLGIFPEGWQFELSRFFVIWNDEKERKVRRFVQELVDKALLQKVSEDKFALHNLTRLYMRTEIKEPVRIYERVLPLVLPGKPLPVIASAWNEEDMVKQLVNDPGIDLNEENIDGLIALQVAAIRGNNNIVQLLLKHGASINQNNKYEKTALISAAQFGQLQVTGTLIKNGADVNLQDSFGFAALHHAAESGYPDIVRLLIANGAVVNIPDKIKLSPIYHAATMGNVDVVIELLRHLPLADQITHPQTTPLSMAAGNGHTAVMKVLLDAGEDINRASPADGTTVLHYIALEGNADVVEFIIKAGAALDTKDQKQLTPLHFAAQKGHAAIIKLLAAAGADVNARDADLLTPLHHAVRSLQTQVVSALIEGGADVNALSSLQIAPLHTAAVNLNKDIAQLLLDAGADVDIAMPGGYTALHWALTYRGNLIISAFSPSLSFSMSEESVSFGAATTASFDDGLGIVQLLLQHGASTESKVTEGYYPIHVAIWKADVESVKLLIEAGASLQVTDPSGKTLREFADLVIKQTSAPQIIKRCQEIMGLLT